MPQRLDISIKMEAKRQAYTRHLEGENCLECEVFNEDVGLCNRALWTRIHFPSMFLRKALNMFDRLAESDPDEKIPADNDPDDKLLRMDGKISST